MADIRFNWLMDNLLEIIKHYKSGEIDLPLVADALKEYTQVIIDASRATSIVNTLK